MLMSSQRGLLGIVAFPVALIGSLLAGVGITLGPPLGVGAIIGGLILLVMAFVLMFNGVLFPDE